MSVWVFSKHTETEFENKRLLESFEKKGILVKIV